MLKLCFFIYSIKFSTIIFDINENEPFVVTEKIDGDNLSFHLFKDNITHPSTC